MSTTLQLDHSAFVIVYSLLQRYTLSLPIPAGRSYFGPDQLGPRHQVVVLDCGQTLNMGADFRRHTLIAPFVPGDPVIEYGIRCVSVRARSVLGRDPDDASLVVDSRSQAKSQLLVRGRGAREGPTHCLIVHLRTIKLKLYRDQLGGLSAQPNPMDMPVPNLTRKAPILSMI